MAASESPPLGLEGVLQSILFGLVSTVTSCDQYFFPFLVSVDHIASDLLGPVRPGKISPDCCGEMLLGALSFWEGRGLSHLWELDAVAKLQA